MYIYVYIYIFKYINITYLYMHRILQKPNRCRKTIICRLFNIMQYKFCCSMLFDSVRR